MTRRRTDALADAARRAAAGRNVVLSVGSMDGAFLAALAKVQLAAAAGAAVSTWADGVDGTANHDPTSRKEG